MVTDLQNTHTLTQSLSRTLSPSHSLPKVSHRSKKIRLFDVDAEEEEDEEEEEEGEEGEGEERERESKEDVKEKSTD